ncbi:hypothetical protein ASE07_24220 [Noviherbaspirillum sp. Root189]|nr:hypothetical protein ASE07_24220 [Noviherbaspirillum sp. Root189]
MPTATTPHKKNLHNAFYTDPAQAYTDSCALHCSEVNMQKFVSRSSPLKAIPVGDISSSTPALFDTDKSNRPEKLTREDVSRCINIWAKMYRLNDDDTSAAELCMPARTWLGRSPDRLKRFE